MEIAIFKSVTIKLEQLLIKKALPPLPQFLPLCRGDKNGAHLVETLRNKREKASKALKKQYVAHNKHSVNVHTG